MGELDGIRANGVEAHTSQGTSPLAIWRRLGGPFLLLESTSQAPFPVCLRDGDAWPLENRRSPLCGFIFLLLDIFFLKTFKPI